MIGKKINQLATELAPVSTDLTIIGDPVSGVSKKITLAQLGAIFSGAVSFYNDFASFPATGDINVIYCAKDTKKLYLWSGSAYVEVFPSQSLLDTYQLRSEKGVSNGYASLDVNGKVPIGQLPNSIMEYKGTWSAATNTPTLANGTGDTGDVYICNAAGSVNFGAGAISFAVGDYVVYSGTIWQRSSGAVGTVTSVAASITGDAIGITGSPVTTSGTLAFAFGGNSTQYINGAGNLVTFPGVINEAQNLITEVYNKTGATLTKGTVVYINGGQGNLPSVTKALATGDSTSAQTYGIVRNDITNNNNGYVVVAGRISDLDTQAYTEGTQLYLSPTAAGTYTSTKPYAPNHLVYVGIVVRAHPTQGVVEVKIQNGYEMDELHNVAAQSPDNNDILQYKTATSLWTKVAGTTSNIAEGSNLYYTDARSRAALSFTAGSGAYNSTTGVITIPTNTNQLTNGAAFITLASLSAGAGISYNNTTGVIASTITQYTDALARAAISLTTTGTSGAATYNSTTGVLNVPQYAPDLSGYVPTSRTLTINGTAYDLSANRSWSVGTVTSVGLSSATSGVTIGSSPITTSGTITLAIATASGSQQGLLSSTDWTTFNNKQNALTNPVTGTGTTNYLPKFTGTSTIGNSTIYETSGGNIGIGTITPDKASWGSKTVTIEGTANTAILEIGRSTSTTSGNLGIVSFYNSGTYAEMVDLISYADGAVNSGGFKIATMKAGVYDTRLTLTSGGNLGLGVTPSAWYSSASVLQVSGAALEGRTTVTQLWCNGYVDTGASGNFYINTGYASKYTQISGQHQWFTAPSGTAGNAISFTQAMTLDASGNLGVGTTSPTQRLTIQGNLRFNYSDGFGYFGLGYVSGADYGFYNYNYGRTDLLFTQSTGAATFSSSVTVGGSTAQLFLNGSGGYAWVQYQNNGAGDWIHGTNVGGSANDWRLYNYGTSSGALTIAKSNNAATFSSSVTAGALIKSTNAGAGFRHYYNNGSGNIEVSQRSDNKLQIYAYSGTAYTDILLGVDGASIGGNVGIGTTSPDIFGRFYTQTLGISSSGSTAIQINGGSGSYGQIDFGAGGVRTAGISASANETQWGSVTGIPAIIYTNGAERMRITSGGNVEINTGSIKTGEPDTGWGRAAIKIGASVSGAAFNVTRYLPVNVDGTVYYINLNSSTP